jgi:mono/diheme cytochrome c family protein
VRLLAGALLLLPLAACSKHEAPPQVAAASAPAGQPAPAPATEEKQAAPAPNPAPTDPAPAAPSPVSAQAGTAPSADALAQGEALFKGTCATCHMADGSGVPFLQPAIKGSPWISAADPQLLLSLILRGSAILGEASKAYDNDMAPQDHLTDAEIAALATYVRQRFGTPPVTKPVTPAEVAVARARPGLPE